jgi:hypothetical protein
MSLRKSFRLVFLVLALERVLNWEFSRCSGIALVRVSIICIAMMYLEAILQSIISIIVFVYVRANNQSKLLY